MPGSTRTLLATLGVVAAIVAALALTLFSVGTVERRGALERFVADVGPIEPEAYAPGPVPDAENAASKIRGASEALSFRTAEGDGKGDLHWIRRCAEEGPGVVPAWNLDEVRSTLAGNAAAFEAFESAVPLARADWKIDYRLGLEAMLPDWRRVLRGAHALACDGRLAIADGEFDRATRRIATLGRLARAVEEEPTPLFVSIGSALERIHLAVVQDAVRSPVAPAELLTGSAASLLDVDLRGRWRTAIAVDAACTHRSMERHGMLPDSMSGNLFQRGMSVAVWSVAGEGWLAYHLDRTTALAEAHDGTPLIESRTRAPLAADPPWWSPWLRDFTAFHRLTLERAAVTEAQRAIARRALALRLASMGGDAYPSRLDPPSTPSDDPFSGEPFSWTVAADGSAVLSAPVTGEFAARTLSAKRSWWSWSLPPPSRAGDKPPAPTRLTE
ncbi:MAG TPA: hypothetical protein VF139_17880 [Candidatus Polarisedimenticolaceae bacterium]